MSHRSSCSLETSRRLRLISAVKFLSAALVIRFAAVKNTMHNYGVFLKIEQHEVVTAAQPIIAIEVRQSFHVTVQTMFESRHLRHDLPHESFGDAAQIMERRLCVLNFHALIATFTPSGPIKQALRCR